MSSYFTKISLPPILELMMKKTLISALVILLAAGPAFADGSGRKSPKCCHKKQCCVKKAGGLLVDGLEFVVKLPFRLVTATAEGLYDLTVHQDLGGFEDGYKRI